MTDPIAAMRRELAREKRAHLLSLVRLHSLAAHLRRAIEEGRIDPDTAADLGARADAAEAHYQRHRLDLDHTPTEES